MKTFNYTTEDGDRIDLLAHRFYGGMYGISILTDANPAIPLDAIFPLGTVLHVPLIENDQIVENSKLPPWK